jgi:hypothetical protein
MVLTSIKVRFASQNENDPQILQRNSAAEASRGAPWERVGAIRFDRLSVSQ